MEVVVTPSDSGAGSLVGGSAVLSGAVLAGDPVVTVAEGRVVVGG
jgi:hypothetical protein